MIELRITGCCRECYEIDLHLVSEPFGRGRAYALRCVHENVCGKLEKERFVQKLKDAQVPLTPEANLRPMETRKK